MSLPFPYFQSSSGNKTNYKFEKKKTQCVEIQLLALVSFAQSLCNTGLCKSVLLPIPSLVVCLLIHLVKLVLGWGRTGVGARSGTTLNVGFFPLYIHDQNCCRVVIRVTLQFVLWEAHFGCWVRNGLHHSSSGAGWTAGSPLQWPWPCSWRRWWLRPRWLLWRWRDEQRFMTYFGSVTDRP